jgi:hypothetical protein
LAKAEVWSKKFKLAYDFMESARALDSSNPAWYLAVERCLCILGYVTKNLAAEYVHQKRGVKVHSIGEIGKAMTQYGLISQKDQEAWIGLVSLGDQLAEIRYGSDAAVIRAIVTMRQHTVFLTVFNALPIDALKLD